MAGENDGGGVQFAALAQNGGVIVGASKSWKPVQAEGLDAGTQIGKVKAHRRIKTKARRRAFASSRAGGG
jgi:hypothetical protein